MQVALFGGSFNPPHVGHLLAALYVRATLEVDEVWLVPSYQHPFGKPLAPYEHRLAMCEAMAREVDVSSWLKVSVAEREVGGEGRTVELLEHLVRAHPSHRFLLVIGSDIVPDLPLWKDVSRIEELARVVVLSRAGHQAPGAIGPPLAQVSSTQVRAALERGELPHELVPRSVLAYAQRHQLYGLARARPTPT